MSLPPPQLELYAHITDRCLNLLLQSYATVFLPFVKEGYNVCKNGLNGVLNLRCTMSAIELLQASFCLHNCPSAGNHPRGVAKKLQHHHHVTYLAHGSAASLLLSNSPSCRTDPMEKPFCPFPLCTKILSLFLLSLNFVQIFTTVKLTVQIFISSKTAHLPWTVASTGRAGG